MKENRNEPVPTDAGILSPPCPFCDERETEVLSLFGGQLSVAQCWCHRCRTGFDYLKWGNQNEESQAPW